MHTLIKSNVNDKIFKIIEQHIKLFDSFEHVYLFGSILDKNRIPNDIDILLIYLKYSGKIMDDIRVICSILEEIIGLSIDLTVLSIEEEKNTAFLNRLNSLYLKLK